MYNARMKQISEERLRGMVRIAIRVEGSQKAFAQKVGISETHLTDVLKERRSVPRKVLEFLGLERVTLYRRIDNGQL